jgi:hypothetical protein
MASYRPDMSGGFPADGDPPLSGPLMTLGDWATLAQAPRRPVGTEISVRATPIGLLDDRRDHMFVHYDDGQDQLIARGGPTEGLNPLFFSRANRVAA